jgi:hypothetical protein
MSEELIVQCLCLASQRLWNRLVDEFLDRGAQSPCGTRWTKSEWHGERPPIYRYVVEAARSSNKLHFASG